MPVIEAQCASILVPHDHRHINQDRMRRRGRWDSPGGGAGPREVDARYLRGTWQVDQGHQLGWQVAVVLAWQVTRCAICLRCAGIGCRRIVPGPCRGFDLVGAAPAASSGAPGAAIIVVTGAGITVLNPGIPGTGHPKPPPVSGSSALPRRTSALAGCAWGHGVLPAGLRRSGGSADSVRGCPCDGPPGCPWARTYSGQRRCRGC